MSYKNNILRKLNMPDRQEVKEALLKFLLKYNGTIKEFSSDQDLVQDIADEFHLSEEQRFAYLETIYRKENRVKRALLWHRLLFRAADNLANEELIIRPSETVKLTDNKEWMLTEKGYEFTAKICGISESQKEFLAIKSYEVQKIINKNNETITPDVYTPFIEKKAIFSVRNIKLRKRAFRLSILEAYDKRCAVCGL